MKGIRHNKILVWCFALACLITKSFAQTTDTTQTLTLQQCIQIALKNNNDVQHSEVTSGIAKANWQGAKGYLIPTLNGDISHGLNNGRSIDPYTNNYSNQSIRYANYSLLSGLTLFNVFSTQYNIKQNKLAYKASNYEVQNSKDIVALDVILQYLQILTNEDLLSASTQQQDISQKQVERLDILNQEGAISPSLYYDLKGEFARNQLSVINAKNDLETAKVLLAQLLNIPYSQSRQYERISVTDLVDSSGINADSVYNAAIKNLAVIKAAELRNSSAAYNVKTYRSQRYPTLYFNGGLFTNYSSIAAAQQYVNTTDVQTNSYILENGNKVPVVVQQDNFTFNKIDYGKQFSNNFNSTFSIGISIPLLNNFRNRTQIKVAVLQQKDAEITLNTTKIHLQQSVSQAYVYVTSAQSRFDALTDQVNAYKESFREAEIKFNAGAINSVDYLVTKNNLDQANLNLIIARYDYVLRSMVLDYYSGKLTF